MIPVLLVPTLRRADLLAQMLLSVDRPVDRLVVVDNGRHWPRHAPLDLPETPWAAERTLVELPGNLGVAGGWNLGVKATPYADWWLIVNDDLVWPPGALERAEALAGPDRVVTFGSGLHAWSAFALGWEVVRDVGLFDEQFHPAYFEDTDYRRRLELKGGRYDHADLGLGHRPSQTIAAGDHFNAFSFRANKARHDDKAATKSNLTNWSIIRRRALGWDRPGA